MAIWFDIYGEYEYAWECNWKAFSLKTFELFAAPICGFYFISIFN